MEEETIENITLSFIFQSSTPYLILILFAVIFHLPYFNYHVIDFHYFCKSPFYFVIRMYFLIRIVGKDRYICQIYTFIRYIRYTCQCVSACVCTLVIFVGSTRCLLLLRLRLVSLSSNQIQIH